MTRPLAVAALLTLAAALQSFAQPSACQTSFSTPRTIAVPIHPFAITPAPGGCAIFVSGFGGSLKRAAVAVLQSRNGSPALTHAVPLKTSGAFGMALTHDGRLLIVTAGDSIFFLDAHAALLGPDRAILGVLKTGASAGAIAAAVTRDDKLLFISNERRHSITVVDLERARRSGYKAQAIVGTISTGIAPIALVLSPDDRWLYSTSEVAAPAWKWPAACRAEGRPAAAPASPEGALLVIDVARARQNPAEAVVSRVPSGCRPVRLAISPDAARVYVTASEPREPNCLPTATSLA